MVQDWVLEVLQGQQAYHYPKWVRAQAYLALQVQVRAGVWVEVEVKLIRAIPNELERQYAFYGQYHIHVA